LLFIFQTSNVYGDVFHVLLHIATNNNRWLLRCFDFKLEKSKCFNCYRNNKILTFIL